MHPSPYILWLAGLIFPPKSLDHSEQAVSVFIHHLISWTLALHNSFGTGNGPRPEKHNCFANIIIF